jgi:hypothetical protein
VGAGVSERKSESGLWSVGRRRRGGSNCFFLVRTNDTTLMPHIHVPTDRQTHTKTHTYPDTHMYSLSLSLSLSLSPLSLSLSLSLYLEHN